MTYHGKEPPDPIPDGWTLLREAILFEFGEPKDTTTFPAEFREEARDLPGSFNKQAIHSEPLGNKRLWGYAKDHEDEETIRNAPMDPSHGLWNGIWINLQDLGYTTVGWNKMESYETDEVIDHPVFDEPRPEVRDYLYELPPPPSQR